jgi:hypothetical protein
MGLIKRLLGKEKRLFDFLLQGMSQILVPGPELGDKMILIFLQDVVEGDYGM